MIRFQIGPNDQNTTNLTFLWPSNKFAGLSQNARTATKVVALNRTIKHCGWLMELVGGLLPAGMQVLLITGEGFDTTATSFADLRDTLIVIFQCGSPTSGQFKNYAVGAGTRSTKLVFGGTNACTDTATYLPDSLIDVNGLHASGTGAGITFNLDGSLTYFNNACVPPLNPASVIGSFNATARLKDTSICPGQIVPLYTVKSQMKLVKMVWRPWSLCTP